MEYIEVKKCCLICRWLKPFYKSYFCDNKPDYIPSGISNPTNTDYLCDGFELDSGL